MNHVKTFLKTAYWLVIAGLIALAAFGSVVFRRSRQLETMVAREAVLGGLDPRLLIALVEKSSNFQTTLATNECYGLLALSAGDGRAWAAQAGAAFDPFDLFDPRKNLQAGVWKLNLALRSWSRERDPRIWALAGWRTNRETVRAWADAARGDPGDPLRQIRDPRVRAFVTDILRQTQREGFTLVLPWE